ncbi:DNA-protecting protein DprA [Anaerosalibacter bizertensis]|uniref:DNA-protecting protein DprA n=1 Tax=Anaerosalibacter bizertensis TaxID=932217 RepID=A0A844FIX9_9FIRM|nr:DNA-processing protein DprA [Anaerosalibacter bizertensis]MBU5293310.1 DNA-processing protein DprA [Anaerosalibacter bizertensis]MSS43902.1 DNA-protecting protein DprA [Anaerosalibacter bizertensis]HHV27222.1 DNA-protecting protein DprA [Tissierellia bacterium]
MSGFSNKETLIWLNKIRVSNIATNKLLEYFENISDIWKISNEEILNIGCIRKSVRQKIISNRQESILENALEEIEKNSINVMTVLDEDYPDRLRYIYDNPTVLYYKGYFSEVDKLSLGIVGSRKATSYGKWASEKISSELAELGITVVSGMARGIDTEAHKGALKGKGRTIAILGSGLDIVYPKNNRKLYDKICECGAVVSEFPIGTEPFPANFPQRNRIISGLSLGILVIEATEKSGSLITVEHAIEQGKEVFALPGNINSIFSRGTNCLIKDGAKIVMDIEDILEEINEFNHIITKQEEEVDYSQLSSMEIKIVECIKKEPIHCDNIVYMTGLDISTVNSTLTILELKGIVKELPGRVYVLS